MTATAARLDAIEAQLGTITPGPWRTEPVEQGKFAGLESRVYSMRGSHILLSPSDGKAGQATTANAEFIAAAPDTIRDLLTLARKQAAALECVGKVADSPDIITRHPKGDKTFYVEAHRIRAAIRAALGDGDE